MSRRPILLETEDGTTLPGEFVWTPDNRGHGNCPTCNAAPWNPCFQNRLYRTSETWWLRVDEPFVHAGRP